MKAKIILVVVALTIVGAIAYVAINVVGDMVLSPYAKKLDGLVEECRTSLLEAYAYSQTKLTTEEQSFVGGWTVSLKAHPGVLATNATLWYWLNANRTYTTVDPNGQTAAGTWCMMSGNMLFATTTSNGVLLIEPQTESYHIWTLQQTTDPDIYNVTKIATIYSGGEYRASGDAEEAPLQDIATVTMSRI